MIIAKDAREITASASQSQQEKFVDDANLGKLFPLDIIKEARECIINCANRGNSRGKLDVDKHNMTFEQRVDLKKYLNIHGFEAFYCRPYMEIWW